MLPHLVFIVAIMLIRNTLTQKIMLIPQTIFVAFPFPGYLHNFYNTPSHSQEWATIFGPLFQLGIAFFLLCIVSLYRFFTRNCEPDIELPEEKNWRDPSW